MHVRVLRFAGLIASLLLGAAAPLAQDADEIGKLNRQAKQAFKERKYTEALAAQRVVADNTEKLESGRAGAPGKQTAEALNSLSWYAQFARASAEALQASERAHALVPGDLVIETGRAHALLLLGRTSEARRLYLAHKGKRISPESDKTWEDAIDEDFDALRAAGIVHQAFPKIIAELGVKHPELTAKFVAVSGDIDRLLDAGKHQAAATVARTLIALARQRYGEERSEFAGALNQLAFSREKLGQRAAAEPLYKRSFAIHEKALGREHLLVAISLNNLAGLYRGQSRHTEAEPLLKRSLAIRETRLGPEHPSVASSLNTLAGLYQDQGRYPEARPLYERSIAIREKVLGSEHPDLGISLNNLAELYRAQGRYGEAEPLYKRGLVILETALGREHSRVALTLDNLAGLYQDQGRYGEAEPLHKRSLAIAEKALGPDHLNVGKMLNNLASLYWVQERYSEAEPFVKRGLAILEKALGPEHPDAAAALNNLANLYQKQGRARETEQLLKRSLAIWETALGREHPQVAVALNSLARLYETQGRYRDAEPADQRGLAIREKTLGPEHPDVAESLNNLAGLYRNRGRYAEAEQLYKRSLVSRETLGSEHPIVASTLNNLALLAFDRGDWALAADYWRRSTGVIERRTVRGLGGEAEGSAKGEAQRTSGDFIGLVKMTHLLEAGYRTPGAPGLEMFETAQWPQASEAAASLAQMAARSATGSPELAALVRARQDLIGEFQAKEKRLIAAKGFESARRNTGTETALAVDLAAIDKRLAAINGRLDKEFPDFAALARPLPLSVAEVQTQLGKDEALVLFLDTQQWGLVPEETFVWVVTKSEVRWVRSELGTAALTYEVLALRCGLDGNAWDGDGAKRCADALGLGAPGKAPDPLPFDHSRAHKLYLGLFGHVEDLISGKHLLIVPSGALTQLPFQALVTEPAKEQTPIAWFARKYAVTILPAVSSLKALRRVGRPSAASRPMIGFGNPLLMGDIRDKDHAAWAKLARERQDCPDTRPQRVAVRGGLRGNVRGVETRGGLATLTDIKGQVPLPETADELCAVAQDVKAETGRDVLLGAKATETKIKRLSATGELAKYRMVHFATHGVLAGELKGTHEPGLILTPPETASEEDDGYLSASEIAGLQLDADWVILSACNTAAGGATNAEALSGLARTFIYAGARALVVSHWAVASDAAVELTKAAVGEMARNPHVGRAEALRRAMVALIEHGGVEAHPSYWAPFVVVGEGSARQ